MACSENLRVKVSNGSHGTHVLKKESQAVREGSSCFQGDLHSPCEWREELPSITWWKNGQL